MNKRACEPHLLPYVGPGLILSPSIHCTPAVHFDRALFSLLAGLKLKLILDHVCCLAPTRPIFFILKL